MVDIYRHQAKQGKVISIEPVADKAVEADYQRIDISQARSIGTETLGLHAVRQLQLDEKLTALGF